MARALPNTVRPNTFRPNEGGLPFTEAHPRFKFRMEVFSEGGTRLDYLPDFSLGEWERSRNRPANLNFDYPLNQTSQASNLTWPNQVWLFDASGNVLDKFHIGPTDEISVPGKMNVEANSLLQQLKDEWIINYEATEADGKTIKEILEDWLDPALTTQVHPLPISLGRVDSAIGDLQRNVLIDKQPILQSIYELIGSIDESITPYWLYVKPQGRTLQLTTKLGTRTKQRIRHEKNMIAFRRMIDPEETYTRVYGFGKNGIDLTDADEPEQYVQDTSEVPGNPVKPFVINDNTIDDPQMLLDTCNAFLEKRKRLFTTFEVHYIDLSKTQRLAFPLEGIDLGSQIIVTSILPDVQTEMEVRGLTTNLDNPLDVKIRFDNDRKQTAEELIADILENLRQEAGIGGGGGGGVIIEDTVIPEEDTAVGTPGDVTSDTTVSGSKHSHPLTSTSVDNIIFPALVSDAVPADVAAAGSAGAGDRLSRDTHAHKTVILPYLGP